MLNPLSMALSSLPTDEIAKSPELEAPTSVIEFEGHIASEPTEIGDMTAEFSIAWSTHSNEILPIPTQLSSPAQLPEKRLDTPIGGAEFLAPPPSTLVHTDQTAELSGRTVAHSIATPLRQSGDQDTQKIPTASIENIKLSQSNALASPIEKQALQRSVEEPSPTHAAVDQVMRPLLGDEKLAEVQVVPVPRSSWTYDKTNEPQHHIPASGPQKSAQADRIMSPTASVTVQHVPQENSSERVVSQSTSARHVDVGSAPYPSLPASPTSETVEPISAVSTLKTSVTQDIARQPIEPRRPEDSSATVQRSVAERSVLPQDVITTDAQLLSTPKDLTDFRAPNAQARTPNDISLNATVSPPAKDQQPQRGNDAIVPSQHSRSRDDVAFLRDELPGLNLKRTASSELQTTAATDPKPNRISATPSTQNVATEVDLASEVSALPNSQIAGQKRLVTHTQAIAEDHQANIPAPPNADVATVTSVERNQASMMPPEGEKKTRDAASAMPVDNRVIEPIFKTSTNDMLERGIVAGAPLGAELRALDVRPAAPSLSNAQSLQVMEQITRAISEKKFPIEIALDPPELGAVKISIASNETGVTYLVQAERPETLELMRRNIVLLHEAIGERANNVQVNISFGSPDDQKQSTSREAWRAQTPGRTDDTGGGLSVADEGQENSNPSKTQPPDERLNITL